MDHNTEFEQLIKKDRDMHKARSWRGNLLGYLEKVKTSLAKNLSNAQEPAREHIPQKNKPTNTKKIRVVDKSFSSDLLSFKWS